MLHWCVNGILKKILSSSMFAFLERINCTPTSFSNGKILCKALFFFFFFFFPLSPCSGKVSSHVARKTRVLRDTLRATKWWSQPWQLSVQLLFPLPDLFMPVPDPVAHRGNNEALVVSRLLEVGASSFHPTLHFIAEETCLWGKARAGPILQTGVRVPSGVICN